MTTSQNTAILSWLKSGNTLTQREATNRFDCTRLAARVHDLRAEGHAINRVMVETETGKRVARYSL